MNKFFIISDNESAGPFTVEELARQNITPDTTVCAEGSDEQLRSGDVEELKAIFTEQPEIPPAFNPSEHNGSTDLDSEHHETVEAVTIDYYRKLSTLKFFPAVKTCLLKLFTFKGRARRSEFWWLILAYLIVFNLIEIVMYFSHISGDVVLKYILFPLSCVLIVSATVRRLHDSGRSGLWIFLGFIPILLSLVFNLFWIVTLVANLFLIALLCDDSEKCENKYGPSPKYVDISKPEQLLKLQNDKETKASSILFPIITFIGISLFQSYLLLSSVFSIFGSLFGGGESTYDPFDIEISDSARYVNDSTFIFDDVDTSFLQGVNGDSIIFNNDSLADTIAITADTISTKNRRTICRYCGNYMESTSRMCPICGKTSGVDIPTDCF
jgi:uncharacterized membrane protein YhaH (DUF805 family)